MTTKGRLNYYSLTNKSGGAATVGLAVSVYTSADSAFTLSTTANDNTVIGTVMDASIANDAAGIIQIFGSIGNIASSASITRGHYIKKGTTSGKVITTGVLAAPGTKAPLGSIGIALTAASGAATFVAYLFPTAARNSKYDIEDQPVTPNAMDDEFDDTTGNSGPTNGLNAKWTWRNQSTSTITFPQVGVAKLTIPASASNALRGIEQTMPGDGAWQVYCSLDATAADYALGGMWMIDHTNGDIYGLYIGTRAVSSNVRSYMQIIRWTNVTTYASDPLTLEVGQPLNGCYLKMQLLSGNIHVFWSTDGLGWIKMGSFADAVGVTRVGIHLNESANLGPSMYFKNFRRVV